MSICSKQHWSNTWGSVNENFNQHWGWAEKVSVAYEKKRAVIDHINNFIFNNSNK